MLGGFRLTLELEDYMKKLKRVNREYNDEVGVVGTPTRMTYIDGSTVHIGDIVGRYDGEKYCGERIVVDYDGIHSINGSKGVHFRYGRSGVDRISLLEKYTELEVGEEIEGYVVVEEKEKEYSFLEAHDEVRLGNGTGYLGSDGTVIPSIG